MTIPVIRQQVRDLLVTSDKALRCCHYNGYWAMSVLRAVAVDWLRWMHAVICSSTTATTRCSVHAPADRQYYSYLSVSSTGGQNGAEGLPRSTTTWYEVFVVDMTWNYVITNGQICWMICSSVYQTKLTKKQLQTRWSCRLDCCRQRTVDRNASAGKFRCDLDLWPFGFKTDQLLFVSNCDEVVNLVKFAHSVCKIACYC